MELSHDVIDIIIDFLPYLKQSKIQKKYYNKISKISINKIIRSMKYNKKRLSNLSSCINNINYTNYTNYININNLSVNSIKANYILYYPSESKLDYIIFVLCYYSAFDIDIDFLSKEDIELILKNKTNHLDININQLFNKLIDFMSIQDLYICGW